MLEYRKKSFQTIVENIAMRAPINRPATLVGDAIAQVNGETHDLRIGVLADVFEYFLQVVIFGIIAGSYAIFPDIDSD